MHGKGGVSANGSGGQRGLGPSGVNNAGNGLRLPPIESKPSQEGQPGAPGPQLPRSQRPVVTSNELIRLQDRLQDGINRLNAGVQAAQQNNEGLGALTALARGEINPQTVFYGRGTPLVPATRTPAPAILPSINRDILSPEGRAMLPEGQLPSGPIAAPPEGVRLRFDVARSAAPRPNAGPDGSDPDEGRGAVNLSFSVQVNGAGPSAALQRARENEALALMLAERIEQNDGAYCGAINPDGTVTFHNEENDVGSLGFANAAWQSAVEADEAAAEAKRAEAKAAAEADAARRRCETEQGDRFAFYRQSPVADDQKRGHNDQQPTLVQSGGFTPLDRLPPSLGSSQYAVPAARRVGPAPALSALPRLGGVGRGSVVFPGSPLHGGPNQARAAAPIPRADGASRRLEEQPGSQPPRPLSVVLSLSSQRGSNPSGANGASQSQSDEQPGAQPPPSSKYQPG